MEGSGIEPGPRDEKPAGHNIINRMRLWDLRSSGPNSWPMRMRPMGCPETSVRNYNYSLRIAQKGAVATYLTAEAWNHARWGYERSANKNSGICDENIRGVFRKWVPFRCKKISSKVSYKILLLSDSTFFKLFFHIFAAIIEALIVAGQTFLYTLLIECGRLRC